MPLDTPKPVGDVIKKPKTLANTSILKDSPYIPKGKLPTGTLTSFKVVISLGIISFGTTPKSLIDLAGIFVIVIIFHLLKTLLV